VIVKEVVVTEAKLASVILILIPLKVPTSVGVPVRYAVPELKVTCIPAGSLPVVTTYVNGSRPSV
jgi:hypothetical protein